MKRCAVECLPQRLPTAIFAARAASASVSGMDERVVEHDVGPREQIRRTHRQQVRRAGAGADEVDGAGHRGMPRAPRSPGVTRRKPHVAGRRGRLPAPEPRRARAVVDW